jgi:serine/threonine protein kinase/tetratricopeptide (TPR) repeat protein
MDVRCLDEHGALEFLEGNGDRRSIQEHLDGCERCRALIVALVRLQRAPVGGIDSATPRPGNRGTLRIGRFAIVGELGAGAMGVVYRAEDPDLRRAVAIKVMRGDYGGVAAHKRMLREAQAMAQLDHPNVVRVYEVGTDDAGDLFIVMEYVDGTTLGQWLREPRDAHAIVDAFVMAGRGLAAAHAVGVVHRDFKPDNAMVDRLGRVKVSDFGLARAHGEISSDGGPVSSPLAATMTQTGALLGTPVYMAPEQLEGRAADARSDQFAFAVAMYEALYGRRPFQGRSVVELHEARLRGPSRPRAAGSAEALWPALHRAMAPDPRDRFGSIDELLAAIAHAPHARVRRTVLVGLGAAALATGAATAALHFRGGADHKMPSSVDHSTRETASIWSASSTDPATVLELGFSNETGDPVFDDTLDVVLMYALRRSPHLDPIAGVDLRKLAGELGSDVAVDSHLGGRLAERDHVRVLDVTGVVRARGAKASITLTATDAVSGSVVFAQTVDAPTFDGAVVVVAHLAAGLRGALGEKLADAERERTGLSSSLDADHEFAVALAMKQASDFDGAIAHYERAIAKDPAFAFAHAQLATQYKRAFDLDKSKEQYRLALQTIDQIGERDRLKILGDYYANVTEESDRAIASYQQLLATWPKDQAAENNIANAYARRGDAKSAFVAIERAARDHPLNLTVRANLPQFAIFAGQYDRAIAELRRNTTEFPRAAVNTQFYLALAYALSARRGEAVAAYARFRAGHEVPGAIAEADFAIAEGRLGDAMAVLEHGLATDATTGNTPQREIMQAMVAELRLRLGDVRGAGAAAATVTQLERISKSTSASSRSSIGLRKRAREGSRSDRGCDPTGHAAHGRAVECCRAADPETESSKGPQRPSARRFAQCARRDALGPVDRRAVEGAAE